MRMSLLKPKTIEEHILTALAMGPEKTTVLLANIDPHIRITKQGFYAALRKLKSEEAVVVYKSVVSLNTAWIKAYAKRIQDMQQTYLPGTASAGILDLQEGESVSYTFADTRHLDTFWGHVQNLLVAQTPVTEPVYAYDPHYWFYIARAETERQLVEDIATSGRQFLMTVGGTTLLDKAIRSDFDNDSTQYHLARLFDANNYYLAVIGKYVVEVLLDPSIAEKIDAVYRDSSANNAEAAERLGTLLTIRGRHKIKISLRDRKAQELKARLGKNFFVRKK